MYLQAVVETKMESKSFISGTIRNYPLSPLQPASKRVKLGFRFEGLGLSVSGLESLRSWTTFQRGSLHLPIPRMALGFRV